MTNFFFIIKTRSQKKIKYEMITVHFCYKTVRTVKKKFLRAKSPSTMLDNVLRVNLGIRLLILNKLFKIYLTFRYLFIS